MKSFSHYTIIVGLLCLASCAPQRICPAYQSFYILDEKEESKHFSLFNQDSLPRDHLAVNKGKFGIMKEDPYLKKLNKWRTVQMEVIMPTLDKELDSVLIAQEIYDRADTTLTLEKKETPQTIRRRDRYNEDQRQYMMLFGDKLFKPQEQQETLDPNKEEDSEDQLDGEEKPKKKGFFNFLKKDKKKKKKRKKDKEEELDIQEEFEDNTETISDTSMNIP
ncbi:hypothetical protein QQ008_20725 [Fulvivirgaceae bacterium BMA10]|uniref:Uncharacterized protein n=1 Tax=Splendidivirga corallicola TaxID=3051826 RepID=A0ABT8KUL9_9BACT|nr:hypothetical protein [Fulvivirgaceae bacterium BMA10]